MAKEAQISTFTNLRGIDGEVQKIQALMKGATSPLVSWLDNAFGMAETGIKDEVIFPMCFNTNSADEQDVRPNDQWVDYCFWTYTEPGDITYPEGMEGMISRKGGATITYPVSCIFFMKLPEGSAYKIQKTQRRQQVWEFFDTLIGYSGAVSLTTIVDHDIKAVFEGFNLEGLAESLFYLPYYGLRINMNITFRNYCA